MEFKKRENWVLGRSIIEVRSPDETGQITWKGTDAIGAGDVFLVRVGKDGSRQVVGTAADAENELAKLRDDLDSGAYRPSTADVRYDTFLRNHWLPWKRKGVKPKTYGECKKTVEGRVVKALGRFKLPLLSTANIQEWVDSMAAEGLSAKTIREYFSLVRASLRWALGLGLITKDPAEGVEKARRSEDWFLEDPTTFGLEDDEGPDRSRVWDAVELQTCIEVAPLDDEMTRWIVVGARGGFRPQEQCGLRWPDIDFERGVVKVRGAIIEVDKERRARLGRWVFGGPKTWWRDVSMPPEAMRVLRAQHHLVQELLAAGKITRKAALFVFPARGRSPRPFNNPSNIKDRLRKFIDGRPDRISANGLPGVRYIPPYGLRHTHATDLLRHGWKPFFVAKRLGTSIVMIDRHYGHMTPDMEEERLQDMTPLPGLAQGPELAPPAQARAG